MTSIGSTFNWNSTPEEAGLMSDTPSSMPFAGLVAWRSGRYIDNKITCMAAGTGTTLAVVAGDTRVYPIWIPQTRAVDRIALRISTGVASSSLRIGLWLPLEDTGEPGALLFDSGVLSGATATEVGATMERTLEAGRYWVGMWSSAAIAYTGHPLTNTQPIAGGTATNSSSPTHYVVAATDYSAGLPDPFPVNPTTANAAGVPTIGIRAV